MADVMEMEPPETRAGMARRQTEQLAEMVVGGWYALAEWWLRHPDVPREELMTLDARLHVARPRADAGREPAGS